MIGKILLLSLILFSIGGCSILDQVLVDYCYDIGRKEFNVDSQVCKVQADIDYYTACVHEPMKVFSLDTFYDNCMQDKGWLK